ncbi:MAG: SURF1 family cytochrome oxidase biogenesis protein, partial [Amphiplicatus sp.]
LRSAEIPPVIAKLFRPDDQPADNLWFTRDPVRFAAHHGIETAPWYIDSSGEEAGAAPWPKGGTTRIDFPNNHLDYALTWFGLAAALVGVYIVFSIKRS